MFSTLYTCILHVGQAGRFQEGKSPLDFLNNAAINIACAIKKNSKQADLHFQLGMILEEQYYAQDMFGLKKEVIDWFVDMLSDCFNKILN